MQSLGIAWIMRFTTILMSKLSEKQSSRTKKGLTSSKPSAKIQQKTLVEIAPLYTVNRLTNGTKAT